MQAAVPEAVDLTQETEATSKMYGLDNAARKVHGQPLLAARRLVWVIDDLKSPVATDWKSITAR